ncbi:MAG: hypothetical protein K8F52_07125 [Candidatus Scalindua rubra]|nr:hypothetical protein [Candidatus Scalindua rubra]
MNRDVGERIEKIVYSAFNDPIPSIIDFIQTHGTVLWWLASASVITFVAALIVVPLLRPLKPLHISVWRQICRGKQIY